jgi:NADH:ubiquinone oxidoreductase subunit 3 (subunit A)
MADQFMPVLITLVVAVGFAVVLLGTAALLGQRTRHRTAAKMQSYESGVPLIDRAHKRISVKFYLVALVFVVLDVEVAFLYPWAINYRSMVDDGSLMPMWEIVAFLSLLSLAYLYLWRKGVFDWGRRPPSALDKGHGAGPTA